MNDSFEEEDFEEEDYGTLIGEGEGPASLDYEHGFHVPMDVISEILSDSEDCDLPISWPEVLSDWTDAGELLRYLESIDGPGDAYELFSAVDGCRVHREAYGDDSPGRSGIRTAVFVEPEQLGRALATVAKLADALKAYWISSGNAAKAEEFRRDY